MSMIRTRIRGDLLPEIRNKKEEKWRFKKMKYFAQTPTIISKKLQMDEEETHATVASLCRKWLGLEIGNVVDFLVVNKSYKALCFAY